MCSVVGTGTALCCPARALHRHRSCVQPQKMGCTIPWAGHLSQTCTWLLYIRISIRILFRRCLCFAQLQHATVGRGPDPSLEEVSAAAFFQFFCHQIYPQARNEVHSISVRVTRHQDSFRHHFLPKWILIPFFLVLMRNHFSVN